ncbi:septum site-determining protein Ssd [Prauserella cavernicola]|uniref:Helicase n=1 Tax=Prauserella cavernicola TaxID=2800127 RepID=A0A934QRN2_9PSEU|nr:septum site-determining protein Ssd [Prauserella cavernicola]MBK1785100.1 helicase [Prauserella cavernicola]
MQQADRPLVVASDDTVLDEIQRIAAAVGCESEWVRDLGAAREHWAHAPLVLVDDTAALLDTPLPRRADVLLVCKGAPEPASWRRAFALGARDVVTLPDGEDTLVAAFADVAEGPSDRRGRVLAVVGGRGGAGASVLAASVGLGVARTGGSALLVDCDPLGGGVDLLLGSEQTDGVRWPGLRVQSGRVSMAELEAALPARKIGAGRLSVLSCDREGPGPSSDAVAAVVEAGRRAGRTVVCDVPRHPDAAAAEALRHADLVVLVVPAEVRSCVGATRVLAGLDCPGEVRVLARGPAPDGLSPGEVADAVGVALLGSVRTDRGLARAVERGAFNPRPGSALGRAARTVLDALHSAPSC